MSNKIYKLFLNEKEVCYCECDNDGSKYNVNFSEVDDVMAFVGVLISVIKDLPNGKVVLNNTVKTLMDRRLIQ